MMTASGKLVSPERWLFAHVRIKRLSCRKWYLEAAVSGPIAVRGINRGVIIFAPPVVVDHQGVNDTSFDCSYNAASSPSHR